MTDEKKPHQEVANTANSYHAARFVLEMAEVREKNWGLVRQARALGMSNLMAELEGVARNLDDIGKRVKPAVFFEPN